jgi:hypothetical protein
MEFPTKDAIAKADVEQLARWYRFLLPEDAEQQKLMETIKARLKEKGEVPLSPTLSRKIGYGGV